MSELALVLEAASHLHIISVTADPHTATRRVSCACGWRSERERFHANNEWSSLAKQVEQHLLVAQSSDWGGWHEIDKRRTPESDEFLLGPWLTRLR